MKSTMTTMPVPTPVFADSTCNNCTFQIITNPKSPPPTEDFSDIDIQELFADMYKLRIEQHSYYAYIMYKIMRKFISGVTTIVNLHSRRKKGLLLILFM